MTCIYCYLQCNVLSSISNFVRMIMIVENGITEEKEVYSLAYYTSIASRTLTEILHITDRYAFSEYISILLAPHRNML